MHSRLLVYPLICRGDNPFLGRYAMQGSPRRRHTDLIDSSPPRVERNVNRRRPLRLARKFDHFSGGPRAEPPQPRLNVNEHLRREIPPKKGPQHSVVVILVAESRGS